MIDFTSIEVNVHFPGNETPKPCPLVVIAALNEFFDQRVADGHPREAYINWGLSPIQVSAYQGFANYSKEYYAETRFLTYITKKDNPNQRAYQDRKLMCKWHLPIDYMLNQPLHYFQENYEKQKTYEILDEFINLSKSMTEEVIKDSGWWFVGLMAASELIKQARYQVYYSISDGLQIREIWPKTQQPY